MARPRFLYHGTAAANHIGIAMKGLRTRKETGISNWHGQHESSDDAVYLTNTYPTFFAAQARTKKDSNPKRLAIYEIDTYLLNSKDFCADEDVLTLWMREESAKLSRSGETKIALDLRLEDRRSQMRSVTASRSLEALGTCAHIGNIPTHAITRALFYDTDTAAEMIIRGLDPVINLTNFQLFGEEYKQSVCWLFRYDKEDSGQLSGMDYNKRGTDCPRFNMWKNEHYIGAAEFTIEEFHGHEILTPVKES